MDGLTTTPAPLTTDDDGGREWAIRAAKMDASLLISPRARARALEILGDGPTDTRAPFQEDPIANAARVILRDGGAQQGLTGDEYRFTPTTGQWRAAADTLGVFSDV